ALSSGDRAVRYVEKFCARRRVAMYVDESTTIKNHTSQRSKNGARLGRLSQYRRIMTGSPVTKSPMVLFGQFEFLGPGILGSRNFYAFRARYAVLREMEVGGRKIAIPVAFRNLEELSERVGRHSYRVRKEECLD